jgi:lipoprotein-anchoring transpeptidase ErfK/SrfK
MNNRSFILLAAVVVAMFVGAIAVYAYDSSRDERIAEGVVVAGVDVGGMEAGEARALLERELADKLERPVTVRYRGERFTLTPKRARLTVDVGGMVDEAIQVSRSGNVVTRTLRDLTGGEETADIEARVSYSRGAVDRLVRRVRRELNRPARDARVSPSAGGLDKVPSQNGREVRATELASAINDEMADPDGNRVVKPRMKVTKPEVTTAQLAARYPHYIVISRGSFQLRYYRNLRLVKTHRIAVGRVGFDTPAGLYHVQNKAVNPAWSVPEWGGELAGQVIPGGTPQNPLKARWLGIYDGAGIHGTDQIGSLGTAASHGCIRMAIPEVIELYDKVPVGAPVYIS